MSDSLPDVLAEIKARRTNQVETAKTAAEHRRDMQTAAGLEHCVLGPVGGPYKPCIYSSAANMFMPKFK